MDVFCPDCGTKLTELPVPSYAWVRCYACATDCDKTYLRVIDLRNQYPLIETFAKVPQCLTQCSQGDVEAAVRLINRIDYKTVSIVAFEQKLLSKSSE